MESTVVLLLFLVLLVGVMDIGRVLFFPSFSAGLGVGGSALCRGPHLHAATIKNVVAYHSTTAGCAGLFGLTPSMVTVNLYEPGTASARIEADIDAFQVQFISPWLVQDWAPLLRAVLPVESGKRHVKNEIPAIGPQLSASSPLYKANSNREHREQ